MRKYTVSLVLVKETFLSIDIVNQLYEINAEDREEACTIAVNEATCIFPKHKIHIIGSIEGEEVILDKSRYRLPGEQIDEIVYFYGIPHVVIACPDKKEGCEVLHTRPLQAKECDHCGQILEQYFFTDEDVVCENCWTKVEAAENI